MRISGGYRQQYNNSGASFSGSYSTGGAVTVSSGFASTGNR